MEQNQVINGYLPDEKPMLGRALIFALQQFLVMLPATILAAIIMNNNGMIIYSIPAALLASGVATISFLFITKFKIPLYYGSSFSYIPAIAIVVPFAINNGIVDNTEVLGAIIIASILSGLMSIVAGVLIKKFGVEKIDKILPGHITGMIAMVIGLSLAGNTMSGILTPNPSNFAETDWYSVLIAMITFISISILTVVVKKGFISQVPILLGVIIGVTFSYALWVPLSQSAGGYSAYFANLNATDTIGLLEVMPWNTLPKAFNNINLLLVSILAIFPIAFATIPESAAHVNQLDLYVNDLSKRRGDDKDYKIRNLLPENLIGDGSADIIAVVMGGPAGTNYGENISASVITRNFSSYVFLITGVLAILVGILLELSGIANLSLILTAPVVQGVSLYLFGAIAVQGIALMIDKQVDVFDPKVIAVMAFIGIVGLGANEIVITDTFILPAIGVAAFGGILLNLLLTYLPNLFSKKDKNNN